MGGRGLVFEGWGGGWGLSVVGEGDELARKICEFEGLGGFPSCRM